MSEGTQRRLTAIVSADVAGYSRLMGADETGTLAALRAHRSELIDPKINEFGGRIVKTMGDGLLLEFPSVVNATNCAISVQEDIETHNEDVPFDRRLTFRIGINLGDIIVDGDDIHGDGVNVAARLEELAEPGAVLISDTAYHSLDGKAAALFEGGEAQQLKNISRPIAVWRWRGGKSAAKDPGHQPSQEKSRETDSAFDTLLASIVQPAIVVLPFNNLSRNEDLDFFCDGLTESLITDLSQSSRLLVTPRNASFVLKGRTLDARAVSELLPVHYFIEGGIQAMGNKVRVNVQLVDVANNEHIWANRSDGSTDDLFAFQDNLCDLITAEVDTLISSGETARTRFEGTDNPQARMHLRRAAVYHSRYTHESLIKAQESVDKAVELDPEFPGALSLAALARIVRVLHGWTSESQKLLAEAGDLADRAIQLQPERGTGHAMKGFKFLLAREFEAAVSAAAYGSELTPSYGGLRIIYARTLLGAGRINEAYHEILQAIRLQPNAFPFSVVILGVICLTEGRMANAISAFRKCGELRVAESTYRPWLAAAHVAEGDVSVAREIIDDTLEVNPSLTIGEVIRPYPVADNSIVEKFTSLLLEAGLPE